MKYITREFCFEFWFNINSITQLAFICSKSTMETPEQCAKPVPPYHQKRLLNEVTHQLDRLSSNYREEILRNILIFMMIMRMIRIMMIFLVVWLTSKRPAAFIPNLFYSKATHHNKPWCTVSENHKQSLVDVLENRCS